jgi:hypothetical protein
MVEEVRSVDCERLPAEQISSKGGSQLRHACMCASAHAAHLDPGHCSGSINALDIVDHLGVADKLEWPDLRRPSTHELWHIRTYVPWRWMAHAVG